MKTFNPMQAKIPEPFSAAQIAFLSRIGVRVINYPDSSGQTVVNEVATDALSTQKFLERLFEPGKEIVRANVLSADELSEAEKEDRTFILISGSKSQKLVCHDRDSLFQGAKERPNDGRSGRCGIRVSGDKWCVLDHGRWGDVSCSEKGEHWKCSKG